MHQDLLTDLQEVKCKRQLTDMRILLLLFLFFCFQQVSQGGEIQYKSKIVSEHIHDDFASGLATAPNKLAILAATEEERGTLYVVHGATLTPPLESQYKEFILDMNEHFIVAGCRNPETVLVYQASSLFELKAKIPIGDGYELENVRITEKSTIVVIRSLNDIPYPKHCDVMIYHYDGFGSWYLSQTMTSQCYINGGPLGLAVSESHLVLQGFGIKEGFIVFKKEKKRWVKYQTLEPTQPVRGFGLFVAMDGEKLAIPARGSTHQSFVFTYHLHHTSGEWIQDSTLLLPGEVSIPIITKDLLVVTINDDTQPEVSGLVYKFSKSTNFSDGGHTWKQVTTLKTNGDPVKPPEDVNGLVRVENGIVYTGRWVDWHCTDCHPGKVFLHDISKIIEN